MAGRNWEQEYADGRFDFLDRPHEQLRHAVIACLISQHAPGEVIDLGCGPGQFLDRLVKTPAFSRIAGSDVSTRSLQYAARRLRIERMSERQAERVELFQSALTVHTKERTPAQWIRTSNNLAVTLKKLSDETNDPVPLRQGIIRFVRQLLESDRPCELRGSGA